MQTLPYLLLLPWRLVAFHAYIVGHILSIHHKIIRKCTRVYGNFEAGGLWYLGVIKKVKKNGKFDVYFDDDTTDTDFASE